MDKRYKEIQQILTKHILSHYDFRLIRRYNVISYNYFYRVGVAEIETLKNGFVWVLFKTFYDDLCLDEPFIHVLRDYATKQRAEIAFTALTEL